MKLSSKALSLILTASSLTLGALASAANEPSVMSVNKMLEAIGEKPTAAPAEASPEKAAESTPAKAPETEAEKKLYNDIDKKAAEKKPLPDVPKITNTFYDATIDEKDVAKLKDLYIKAAALFEEKNARGDRYAICTTELAAMALKDGDLKTAESYVKKSLDASQDHAITATNYEIVGDIKAKQDRLAEAEAAYGGVLDIFKKYGDYAKVEAVVLEKLAGVYEREGKTAQANAARNTATDLATFKGEDKAAQDTYKAGTKALIANNYPEAIKQFEATLKARPDFKAAKMNLAICYQHEALAHQNKKEYPQAETNYLQALPAMEAAFGPKHAYTCTVLQGLSETLESQNKLSDAEKNAGQWVEIERDVHKTGPQVMNALRIYIRILKANKKTDLATSAEKELADIEAKDKASKPQFDS